MARENKRIGPKTNYFRQHNIGHAQGRRLLPSRQHRRRCSRFCALGQSFAGVASAHIFHYAKSESLEIGNQQTKVARFGSGLDMAISPVFAACEPTHLGKAKAWRRRMVNDRARLGGCITDVSWSIAYVALQPGNPPEPGDSGTPVVQDGKVVGMLLSLSMHTWKEIMMNAELIKREAKL